MTDSWETLLPSPLNNPQDLAKIKSAATAMSRIVAWSWTPPIITYADKKENKVDQEQTLKKVWLQTLERQAQCGGAYEYYGDLEAKIRAERLSEDIKNILLGDNAKVASLKGVKVTLSDVLNQLSSQTLVFTDDPDFTKMFVFRVSAGLYMGQISEVVDENGQPIPDQYISLMPYPPRPALSEFTVMEQQLCNWAENINTGGNYLPPSVYIPIFFS